VGLPIGAHRTYEGWPLDVSGDSGSSWVPVGLSLIAPMEFPDPAKGKCCNFENGDGGRPERNWAARSQAGRSNSWSM